MAISFPREYKLVAPPLENGDRLSRAEFERRYATMPSNTKAELIEGTVYIAPDQRFERYSEPRTEVMNWLGIYAAMTPGVSLSANPTVRLDRDNEFQPDAVLQTSWQNGGPDDELDGGNGDRPNAAVCIEGPPEFVVEISASAATICLGDKLAAYRRSGVKEYLVWQFFDERIDWFCLQNEDYISLASEEQGILRSQVFPGLWLDKNALIRKDIERIATIRQAGLSSSEHKAFLASLAGWAARS
jgi:Uma2 family endonuclease